ncbi:MAG: hypothetical protein QE271_03230 [Bacteriovoracaceae bacterium]|nr:hypothetical protein [Bacteriovoracaceae bacterium]
MEKLMTKEILPEVENLRDLVAEFMEYWGFKKVHGEIWLHLYLSEVPLDASQIMQKLSISKALVSITLKDLLLYGVIQESQISEQNTRMYVANEDISEVIKRVLRKREQFMIKKIRLAHQQLSELPVSSLSESKLNKNRIKDLGKLIKRGNRGLDLIMSLI